MAEIASAYVSLIPSARGFGRATSAQIAPQMRRTGAVAGAGLGRSLLKGFLAIGAITAITRFVGDAFDEARESQKVGALTNNVIESTGGVAKVTAAQVTRLADALSRKTGIDDEQIASSQNMLLTFKNVIRQGEGLRNIFARATRAAVDLSASGFGDIIGTTKQLGKALNDPVKGLTALGRAGVTFTAQQVAQVKALIASGKQFKAQNLILREVESQVKGAAEAQATSGDKARVALDNLKEQIGTALLPALDSLQAAFANKIAPAISGFITNLQTGSGSAGRFGTFIRETVVPALQTFGNFLIDKVVPAVRDGLGNALNSAKSAFNQVSAAVKDNRPQLEQLWAAFKKVAGFILTKVVPAMIALQAKWLPVLGFAIRAIVTAASFWVNAFNKVKSVTITLGNVVAGAVKFFQRLKEGASKVMDNLVAAVKKIPGKIQGVFSGALSFLYSAGKNLIQGLINGIETKINEAVQKVRAGLQKIRDMLPGSPIKDGPLKPWNDGSPGKLLMGLLAKGIADGADKVGEATEKVAKKVKEKLASLHETLKGLKQDFASLVEPISSAFTSDLFSATSASSFVTSLMGTKGQLKGLVDAFAVLIKGGFNPKFLYDLFASGNAGLILDLANNPALAAQASGLLGDVNQLSTQLGQQVAGATPDGKAITKKIDKTNEKLDKLIDHVDKVGAAVGREVNGAASNGHRRAA